MSKKKANAVIRPRPPSPQTWGKPSFYWLLKAYVPFRGPSIPLLLIFVECTPNFGRAPQGTQMAERMTLAKIDKWIAEGRGQGHHTNYLAWILVRRKNSPGGGNLQVACFPQWDRHLHLMSQGELIIGLLLAWLGVDDLREGFPCWLTPHPHPLYLHPHFHPDTVPLSTGAAAASKRLGVRHPRYPGTTIPYIPTLDFLVSVRLKRRLSAVAVQVKPEVHPGALGEDDLIKLAIADEYCRELSIQIHKLSPTMVPEPLFKNLRVLMEYACCVPSSETTRWRHFCDRVNLHLSQGRSIADSLNAAASEMSLSRETASDWFHAGLWHRHVSIDLRQAWVMSQPAHLVEPKWIADTTAYLLGDVA